MKKYGHGIKIAILIFGFFVLVWRPLYLEAPNFDVSELLGNVITSEVKVKPEIKTELLGSASLSYLGSTPGRANNIKLGVERLNGTVVLPGEEFSYIEALGPISKVDGFSEEKAFRNGEVTKGLGGGLCQVSTILFQTVLSAGLPVTERQNHTFAVPFYEVGLDATFANPAPDFKFRNNMNGPIVIRGRTENNTAIFEIYGVPDGRVAKVSDAVVYNRTSVPATKYIYDPTIPVGTEQCEFYSQSGFTTKRIYTVSYTDGTETIQEFISKYSPHARVCRTSAIEYLGI